MIFPLIITAFLLMCTYFVINIYLNKGVMTDIHFYIALIILSFILLYIIQLPSCTKESYVDNNATIIKSKRLYKETKETLSKLKATALTIKKKLPEMYPKVVLFGKGLVQCIKDNARKSKLSEKFLSLS